MSEKRTPQEIEQLKKNWLANPEWDIEDTEGFETHREELLAFRNEKRAEWEAKQEERDNKRIEKVMLATGIGKADRDLLLSLETFQEIENDVYRHERAQGADVQVDMTAALVRATLLQAAQLKRIADALESMADGDTLSNSLKIYGSE